jgi:hypothetical protein
VNATDADSRRRSLGSWLETFQWDHVVHLTTPEAKPADWMAHEFKGGLIRTLALQAQRPTPWFYVIEETTSNHHHIHALLAGTRELSVATVANAWRRGFARATIYRPDVAGAHYLAKELGTDSDNWDFSSRRPPMRGPRLIVFPREITRANNSANNSPPRSLSTATRGPRRA